MLAFRSYLFEIVNCQREIDSYKNAFTINKKNFMSTPLNSQSLSKN